ncbi:MAG: DUF3320 domain-containing protein [Myxococcota bacterium]|nr:DUF3320 domain-containing protein [Myxococcota bacterium]
MNIGDVVGGHYQIMGTIGQGGMATIYQARHDVLGSIHAIKVLNSDLVTEPGVRARFLQEGQLQAQLSHPNLVAVTGIISEPGVAGLVMEHLIGADLSEHLARGVPEAEDSLDWMLQLLQVLGFIHSKGIIHRDVKPSNIFLQTTDTGLTVRLMDFGIARDLSNRQTQVGMIMGTPAYMPPEQRVGGALDHRADLFAAGAVFLELLLGEKTWTGDLATVDLSGLPVATQAILRKALSPAPTERFASAAALSAAIQAVRAAPAETAAAVIDGLNITITASPGLTLAAWQNAIPLIPTLQLINQTETPLADLTVVLKAEPPVFSPWKSEVSLLGPGEILTFDNPELRIHQRLLRTQRERERVVITARVDVGGVPATHSAQTVHMLAPNEWPGARQLPDLLAAFVQPNEPALGAILTDAARRLGERTGDDALAGYQAHSPARVLQMIHALYDAVQATGLTYINPPASFEETGQKIRLSADLLHHRQGTCLDISVLMAALMERIGLHPLLFMVKGHILPGAWLIDFSLKTPVIDDATPILRRIELGEAILFDSSSVAQQKTFQQAVGVAHQHEQAVAQFRFALDIRRARVHRIQPLSLVAPVSPPPDDLQEPRPPAEDTGTVQLPPEQAAAATQTRSRIDRWKSQLLDLSLRNRLLNFKATKKSLSLSPHVQLDAAYAAITSGTLLALREEPPHLTGDDPRTISRATLLKAQVVDEQDRHTLVTIHRDPSVLQTRALELYRQTRTALQESGAVTLYLTLGMLHWYESPSSEHPRLAPLALVPVELIRPKGGASWTIKKADTALINTTLIKKLERDFSLSWSGPEALDSENDPQEARAEIGTLLQSFRKMVLSQGRWKVVSHSHLARFSFTKFLMWRDLDARTADLLKNPVVRHILNTQEHTAYAFQVPLIAHEDLDSRDPTNVLTTMDADPTQLQAIFAAEDGNSFVLQGPPGTGKSQTITNMISALLGQGKTVLFVSEKMAALDVVYSRLSRVGLSRFCLKLHSNKSNKKEIIEAIAEALKEPMPGVRQDWGTQTAKMADSRRQLNEFAALLGTLTPFGETHYQCISRHIALRGTPSVALDLGDPAAMDHETLGVLRENVGHLMAVCENTGSPATHAWRGVGITHWTLKGETRLHQAIAAAHDAAAALRAAAEDASGVLRLPIDTTPASLRQLQSLCDLLHSTPRVPAPLLRGAPHQHNADQLTRWTGHIERRRTGWSDLAQRYSPALLSADLGPLHAQYQKWSSAFFLIALFMLWSARKTMRTLTAGPLPDSQQITDDLKLALTIQQEDTTLAGIASDAQAMLGVLWQGADTDLSEVSRVMTAAQALRRQIITATDEIEDTTVSTHLIDLAGPDRDRIGPETGRGQKLSRLQALHRKWTEAVAALEEDLKLDVPLTGTLDAILERLAGWRDHTDQFRDAVFLRATIDEARAVGLGSLVDALEDGTLKPAQLEAAFTHSFYGWWVVQAFEKSARLQGFRGIDHDRLIRTFKEQDQDIQTRSRDEILTRLIARRPRLQAAGQDTANEMGLLARQLKLKRRHIPIRKLFRSIPESLRRLKPCMLMSPLSVAQYLDPALKRFDVVIFDEASQIPPWDALGAIARGNQVVIVGDTKQLPPTSFFSTSGQDDDSDDEQDLVEMESILEEAAARMRNLSLRWHYRSRHESLITFSNQKYYDNELFTFPAADRAVEGLGVTWQHVPDGFYDRGKSRTNQAEAEAVVAALHRLLSLPEAHRPTVGIVTFSMPQQRRVEDLVDALRLKHPELEPCFSGIEPVFIKNLENVQGDERDVMLFSICYGPDLNGKVAMNFGPLNRQGGERRLNVAITRAKRQLIVFSTLRADQIDLRRTRSVGVRHLKAFLDYADRGAIALSGERRLHSGHRTDSPLEDEVKAQLEKLGWEVHTQVGCSGYRIDLGVVDPEAPGRYILGVECDGATYHSSRCARERDRLRQGVLESLGWHIHRVWSTDWWLKPEREVARIQAAIAQAQAAPRIVRPPPPPPAPEVTTASPITIEALLEEVDGPRPVPAGTTSYTPPSVRARGGPEAFERPQSRGAIAAQVQGVVRDAGPIHRDDLIDLIRVAWGFSRSSKKLKATITGAVARLPARERPRLSKDGCYWSPGMDAAAWRGFRTSEEGAAQRRKVSRISTEEIANLCGWLLQDAKSLSVDALCREAARMFGWRSSTKIRQEMMRGVAHLLKTGRAREQDDMIVIVD